MLAKITLSKNPRLTLQYHEQKVEQGKAECLYAGNFFKDYDQLSSNEKFYHFKRLNMLNERVAKNTVHIVLTFHPSERILNGTMKDIAREYMDKMGLGRQPYLLYRHHDTLHPHAHLVAANIQTNGQKIYLRRAEFYKSKELTRELEVKHGLIVSGNRALDQEWREQQQLKRFVYGQTPLVPTFSKVLDVVVSHYRYASLEDLNAVLGLYNIRAVEVINSAHAFNGLVYKGVRPDGKVDKGLGHIKASSLANKYTLNVLEERFALNKDLREPYRQRVLDTIDRTLFNTSLSPSAFQEEMKSRRISVVFQKDERGESQNVWYVDHEKKTVFDGAMLQGRYTAAALSQRCISEESWQQQQLQEQQVHRYRHSI